MGIFDFWFKNDNVKTKITSNKGTTLVNNTININNNDFSLVIDNAYELISIGVVVYGTVFTGKIDNTDKIKFNKKYYTIKSISKNNEPISSAIAGEKISILFKDANVNDFYKGGILTK